MIVHKPSIRPNQINTLNYISRTTMIQSVGYLGVTIVKLPVPLALILAFFTTSVTLADSEIVSSAVPTPDPETVHAISSRLDDVPTKSDGLRSSDDVAVALQGVKGVAKAQSFPDGSTVVVLSNGSAFTIVNDRPHVGKGPE